jgi:hypothetical protein
MPAARKVFQSPVHLAGELHGHQGHQQQRAAVASQHPQDIPGNRLAGRIGYVVFIVVLLGGRQEIPS